MALEHQLNIVSLVSAVNKAELRLWTLICITRRQDEKKIPSKLFLRQPVSLRDTFILTPVPNDSFFTSLTSPSQVSSLYLCDLSATRVQVSDSSFHLWFLSTHFTIPFLDSSAKNSLHFSKELQTDAFIENICFLIKNVKICKCTQYKQLQKYTVLQFLHYALQPFSGMLRKVSNQHIRMIL